MQVTLHGPHWLQHIISRDPAILWLDTRRVSLATDRRRCSSFCNPAEVSVTKQAVQALLSLGVDASDIGVTSPYSQQVRMLQNAIKLLSKRKTMPALKSVVKMHGPEFDPMDLDQLLVAATRVAVMTIDKFQGQDKASMVISLVRSNMQGHTGTLLSDSRRINVALTRAKHKLVIIGNSDTLCNVKMLKDAFEAVRRLGVIVDLTDSDVDM